MAATLDTFSATFSTCQFWNYSASFKSCVTFFTWNTHHAKQLGRKLCMRQSSSCQRLQKQKPRNELSKTSEVSAPAISEVLRLANASYARRRYVHKRSQQNAGHAVCGDWLVLQLWHRRAVDCRKEL